MDRVAFTPQELRERDRRIINATVKYLNDFDYVASGDIQPLYDAEADTILAAVAGD